MAQSTTAAAAATDLAQIRRLRLASFLEAGTLLILLLVAVPLKHLLGYPLATKVMGPVHGAAFIFYAWTMIVTFAGGGWSRSEIARLGAAAFIPFGGFFNAGLLRRKEELVVAGSKIV
jgi:integral membrane protein